MEVAKIVNENLSDLIKYSKESFSEGKEVFLLTMVATYLYFEKDKSSKNEKKKWIEELVVKAITFLMVTFACVHLLFLYIGSSSKPNKVVSINNTIQWMITPFSKISEDQKAINLLFGDEYKMLESSLRIYIAVLLCIQGMQLIKSKWKHMSPLKELVFYTVVYAFVLGLMIYAVMYVDMVTALAILPLFITMQILVIDRILIYIQSTSWYTFDIMVHRRIVDFFKDILYSVECGKTRYSYSLNVNTNIVLTLTSIIIFLNICYTLYNKGK